MSSRCLLILVATLLGSLVCPALDPFIPPDIYLGGLPGTWTARYGNVTNTITFDDSQKFSGVTMVNDKITDRYEGTWKFSTPYIGPIELIWHYTKSNTLPAGAVDRDEIETLNKKILVFRTQKGLRHTYQRVTPALK